MDYILDISAIYKSVYFNWKMYPKIISGYFPKNFDKITQILIEERQISTVIFGRFFWFRLHKIPFLASAWRPIMHQLNILYQTKLNWVHKPSQNFKFSTSNAFSTFTLWRHHSRIFAWRHKWNASNQKSKCLVNHFKVST